MGTICYLVTQINHKMMCFSIFSCKLHWQQITDGGRWRNKNIGRPQQQRPALLAVHFYSWKFNEAPGTRTDRCHSEASFSSMSLEIHHSKRRNNLFPFIHFPPLFFIFARGFPPSQYIIIMNSSANIARRSEIRKLTRYHFLNFVCAFSKQDYINSRRKERDTVGRLSGRENVTKKTFALVRAVPISSMAEWNKRLWRRTRAAWTPFVASIR